MKRIVLLGASGSLGSQTIDIVSQHSDNFEIIALSVGKNIGFLRDYLKDHRPQKVCVQLMEDCLKLKEEFPDLCVTYGDEGLLELAGMKCDLLINNLQGFVGLKPTLKAIESGNNIALANKETLVAGGYLVREACRKKNIEIMPIDSEHAAIYQCLLGNDKKQVRRLIITASGGSLRDLSREQLKDITVERALAHPNWSMGHKITIDSSTMMNKGFEVIEAHWLYDIPYEQIDV
ncbi:MAG: 1-deoxy-D-xylulose-5-phosphate reductoisomerase, partial [Erysipelotrichaceae bacterium]|nr:1-deoxy-D-xylulose-5-phosphate reductoisomerase [Erysipelotrichaceae bacterium]